MIYIYILHLGGVSTCHRIQYTVHCTVYSVGVTVDIVNTCNNVALNNRDIEIISTGNAFQRIGDITMATIVNTPLGVIYL